MKNTALPLDVFKTKQGEKKEEDLTMETPDVYNYTVI